MLIELKKIINPLIRSIINRCDSLFILGVFILLVVLLVVMLMIVTLRRRSASAAYTPNVSADQSSLLVSVALLLVILVL